MAQPSQQLPSWLTLSSTLITEADGSVSTSFATLRLPLTYFGPSIPLGTDGVWTYGGLTPPPSTAPLTTTAPSASVATSTIIASFPLSSAVAPSALSSSSVVSLTSAPLSSLSSGISTPTPTTSGVPLTIAATSHGISTAVLGAILGSILGFLLLLVVILTLCLIRRNTRRQRLSDPNIEPNAEVTSSSFWNRQTFLSFLPTRTNSVRHTPIWTGWQLVEPDEFDPDVHHSGDGDGGGRSNGGARTPGEGSPRGSGEEIDPFLTRRSIHSGTIANDMSQTKTETDTLVSVPPAAILSGVARSSPPRAGHIIPREVLLQRMQEEDEHGPPYADIRIVEPSPQRDYSPLMPPPPLDPDSLKGLGVRTPRTTSDLSVGSQKHGHSMHSEKSLGSLDESHEKAELLVARRVRVGEHARMPTIESEAGSSTTSQSALGLTGLSSRLGRLSWFKRMSFTGATAGPSTAQAEEDSYTRTPPRSRGHTRPGSQSHLLRDADLEAGPTPRPSRRDSGVDIGLLDPSSTRPISSFSSKSASATSGHTVFHDAPSRPASSIVEFPVPVISPEAQEQLSRTPFDNRGTYSTPDLGIPAPPPAYEDGTLSQSRAERSPLNIDVLDMPAPAPVSQLPSSRPAFPPGLTGLPTPRTWRDSYMSSPDSSGRSSGGIAIDIEDEPPAAQEDWRDLSTDRDGRRRTFGTPNVVQPQGGVSSQHPSVYTMRSHLRPRGSRSPLSRSPVHSAAPSSGSEQTHTGSVSSRPSTHSPLRSMSSAQSLAISSDERREGSDELYPISPPLSAVMGSMSSGGGTRPPSYQVPIVMPPVPEVITPTSPPLSGTVTTTGSSGTGTNSSVTTAATDPVTGAVLHFPPVPWRRDTQRSDRTDSWGRRPRED